MFATLSDFEKNCIDRDYICCDKKKISERKKKRGKRRELLLSSSDNNNSCNRLKSQLYIKTFPSAYGYHMSISKQITYLYIKYTTVKV